MTSRNIYQFIIPFIRKPAHIGAVAYVIVFCGFIMKSFSGLLMTKSMIGRIAGRNKKTAA
ncbi:hypothetical protein [Burkholderia cepacia]|uniref:hypothetical protein n=1 Tax=Burkholderia cepacia TaxID=292 RepID=UPI00265648DC|nr:hypothetical protein [Burkholderia cepacia]MDN7634498.1 hypothetical protein [Burkholderia cepacia]